MEVQIKTSLIPSGEEYQEYIYKNDGSKSLLGLDFGDLETGVESITRYLYYTHDGLEPIYNAGFFIRTVGNEWGGYVPTSPDSYFPNNPNFFKNGGIDSVTGLPKSSTSDYEFLRTSAYNDPEMGVRLHMNRTNVFIKTDGLGYQNRGISSSPITLSKDSLDWTKTSAVPTDGFIYPIPEDPSRIGKAADEAKIGISLKFSDEVVGSGHVQIGIAFKYRYTS